ncbi:MAG TPA: hypothetical protein VM677_14960 [Actinokineospora sp.]|nr:hypothetical protein [Actinokineospora sp.]
MAHEDPSLNAEARRLRLMFVRFSFVVTCIIGLLVSVLLMLQDRDLTAAEVFSSIGLNLFASVIFAFMFSVLTNWVQDRHFRDTLKEGLDDFATEMRKSLRRDNELFLPAKNYAALDPSDGFGEPFNRDVTIDLEGSDFFAFYGPSARYVAARLHAAQRRPQQIRIAMINPANRRAIQRRAADRSAWPRTSGKSIDDIERDLEDELLMNLVSLFDCRRFCPIEVLYNDDTAVYRYVMFDQGVYVSWYHGPQSAEKELPESYRFDKDSFTYSTFRMDLARRFEISSHKVTFEAGQGDDMLIEHLRGLTGREIGPADLARWRAAQIEDSAEFRDFLGKIRHNGGQKHMSASKDVNGAVKK